MPSRPLSGDIPAFRPIPGRSRRRSRRQSDGLREPRLPPKRLVFVEILPCGSRFMSEGRLQPQLHPTPGRPGWCRAEPSHAQSGVHRTPTCRSPGLASFETFRELRSDEVGRQEHPVLTSPTQQPRSPRRAISPACPWCEISAPRRDNRGRCPWRDGVMGRALQARLWVVEDSRLTRRPRVSR